MLALKTVMSRGCSRVMPLAQTVARRSASTSLGVFSRPTAVHQFLGHHHRAAAAAASFSSSPSLSSSPLVHTFGFDDDHHRSANTGLRGLHTSASNFNAAASRQSLGVVEVGDDVDEKDRQMPATDVKSYLARVYSTTG